MSADLFYTALLAFAVGILLETIFTFNEATILWFLLVGFVLAAVWHRYADGVLPSRLVLLASVAILFASLGAMRYLAADETLEAAKLGSPVGETATIEGVVVREPDVRERSTNLYVKTETSLVLVRTDRFAEVAYGDRIRAAGILEAPEPFATDLGRVFDYPGYLKSKGVTELVSFAEVQVIGSEEGVPLVQHLLTLKQAFINQLELAISEPQAGLGKGLLLGVQSGLGDELEQAFRTAGIIHIVVLSGYNIMLVITFVLYGLAFVLPFRLRLLVGLIAIAAFALLVGLSATVVRASVMAALLLAVQFAGKTYAIGRSLVLAGAVMLLINPHLLMYDVGFQLSFTATLGLILLAPWVEARLAHVPSFLKAREFLVATIAVQLFVTPILLYQIGEFSVVALPVNLLVLPIVPVAMLLTFLTGIAGFFSPLLAVSVGYVAHLSLAYIITVAEVFAKLPVASFVVPEFPFVLAGAAYGLIGYVLYRIHARQGSGELVAESNNQTDAFATVTGWTMVDENEFRVQVQKSRATVQSETPVADEMPVFFR